MWTVNVSSLGGIAAVYIKMKLWCVVSGQALAVRTVGAGGHSCAFIIYRMLSNLVM